MQACTLDSNQAGPEQVLMAMPGNLYVLQEPHDATLDDVLVAERSADDLLLAFRTQEQAHEALKLEQFFTNNGNLHVLRQDGELLRAIASQDNPQQGPLSFDLQPASAAAQETAAPVLPLLQQALFPAAEAPLQPAEHTPTVEVEPQIAALSAPVQVTTLGISPLLSAPPQITQALDQIGARQGSLASGSVTDDRYATIEGIGTPGSYLEILDNGEVIGEVQVGSDGRWRFEPDQAFSEAGHVLTARVQGSGESSASFVLVVDTVAPSRAIIDSISDDRAGSQVIDRNGHTSDNTPVIKGRAEPFSVVALYSGKTLIGTSFTDAAGNWEFSSIFIMPDGEYTISATALDFSGNAGLSSTTYKITIDTLPPAVPTIDQVIDDVGPVQGALQSGAVTDDSRPTFSGHAEAGTVVTIYDNDYKLGDVRADESGNWSFTPENPLAYGGHSFTVRAQDAAGNQSGLSPSWDLVLDNNMPEKPGSEGSSTQMSEAIDDHGPIQGPIAPGDITDDRTPTFNGTGEPGDTIIIIDKGEKIGEVVVDDQGKWTFTPETELDDGEHAISVIIRNQAGNESEPSDALEFTVDTQAPEAPSIGGVYDDVGAVTGELAAGAATDDTQPTLSGQAEAGAIVSIFDGEQKLGEVQADENGNWSFTPEEPLAEGEHSFTVRAQDAAGNLSEPSQPWAVIIDTTAPQKPGSEGSNTQIGSAIDDHGPIQGPITEGGVTDDTTPTLNGTGEPGDTIIIRDGEEEIGRVEVGSDGNWSFTPEEPLGEGEHEISVIIQDPAGNQSEPSDPWIVVVDTQAPDAPSIGGVYDDVGNVTGALASGDSTDDTQPTFSGQAEAGAIVSIFDGEQKLGEVEADENGNWSFTPEEPLAEGEHSFTVRAQDAAGNLSEPSQPWAVIIDTTAPQKPGSEGSNTEIGGAIDDHGPIQGPIIEGGVTDDTTPTFNGTGEPGDTIIIRDGEQEIGRVEVGSDGNWSFTPEEPLGEGEHEISVIIQDPAGNQSEPSDPWIVVVDTQAPDAPSIDLATDDEGFVQGPLQSGATTDDRTPTLSGKAEANAEVFVYDNGDLLGSTRADASGNWSFTPETQLNEGEHRFTAAACDLAGNMSPLSDAVFELTVATSTATAIIADVQDNVGPIQGSIVNGQYTDDATPTLSGQGNPGSTVRIYDNGVLLGSVQAGENGKWTFTPDTPLAEGEHSLTVTGEDHVGESKPSVPYVVIVDTTAPTQVATVTEMGKDSGIDSSDWLTSDGSAGRLMQGTLSAALAAHEKLQVSTDGGLTWVDALVDGSQWSALDNNAHGKNWTILARTIDSNGQVGEVSAQDVTLDTLAPKPPVSISKNGETVTVVFDKANVGLGDRISLVNGDERQDYVLTEQDIATGRVTITSSITVSDDMLIGIVDKANNASDYMRSTGKSDDFNYAPEQIGYYNPVKDLGDLSIRYANFGATWLSTDPKYGNTVISVGAACQTKLMLKNPATEITLSMRWYDVNISGKQVQIALWDPVNNKWCGWYLDRAADYTDYTFSLPDGSPFTEIQLWGENGSGILIDRIDFNAVELLPPSDIQLVVENGGMYGGTDDTTFIMETSTLPDGAIVSGGAGVDQLKLTSAGQTIDLSALNAKVSSVEVFDITGTGNNTLKLSLGDLLENGGKNLFLADDNIQLMVKGDAGDKVVLDDLLPNGTDLGDWAAAGTVTVAGVVYETYQHSALNAELLVQQGVTVDLV
ncbi:Ig-like domain-containing protein [Pseudomonas putida]|uniref:Ig-like domain-containing protein n=1 Tax=Pseudomonas putida TaxID=303 RepID=UPI00300E8747